LEGKEFESENKTEEITERKGTGIEFKV